VTMPDIALGKTLIRDIVGPPASILRRIVEWLARLFRRR
jgi:hypothetical protein